ncbi:hypothetical protein ACFL1H_02595 [Nanoarchaeota archaeon]
MEKKFIIFLKASLHDSFWIIVFYLITVLIYSNWNIMSNAYQMVSFLIMTLFASFIWELWAQKKSMWKYDKIMPKMFKVGVFPLLQLAILGLKTFIFVFRF